MLKFVLICLLCDVIHCHNNNLKNEGDMQSELMPQELNPSFLPDKDGPWQAIIPAERIRRDTGAEVFDQSPIPVPTLSPSLVTDIKYYGRIVTGVVVAISAIIEFALYMLDIYRSA